MILLGLVAIPVLIAINAYFVAIEFALVAVRKTRIDELTQQGVRGAASVSRALAKLDRSIAACQLGITLASIALGAVGESVLAGLLEPYLTFIPERMEPLTRHSIAGLLSIGVITFLHVILGEQVPKMMAIQSPDAVALWTSRYLNAFARITSPLLRLMNATGNIILRRLGYKAGEGTHAVHSVEELRMLVESTEEAGLLRPEQAEVVQNAFRLSDKKVRDIMLPKEKIDALEVRSKPAQVLEVVRSCGHTRLPVYDGEIDNIVGILNTKNLFYFLTLGHVVILEDALSTAQFIDPDESIGNALQFFRRTKKPMALVRDKENHVLGMLTLEDVIEEIVGDIEDEHDVHGTRPMRRSEAQRKPPPK